MNRSNFIRLSRLRLNEGKKLLTGKCYSGAYYLSGYCVECALKACIAKKTRKSDFPLDKKSLENIYTHQLEKLIKGAGLEIARDSMIKRDSVFERYWGVVKDWSEDARYEEHDKQKAEDLIKAISDPTKGVLQWIQKYW